MRILREGKISQAELVRKSELADTVVSKYVALFRRSEFITIVKEGNKSELELTPEGVKAHDGLEILAKPIINKLFRVDINDG